MYQNILKKIDNHVTKLFEKYPNEKLVFHTLKHTQDVVNRTKEIGEHYDLSEKEMLIALTAAWFHDSGYLITDEDKHESMSAEMMKKFMTENFNDNELIRAIENCILATKLPTNPQKAFAANNL